MDSQRTPNDEVSLLEALEQGYLLALQMPHGKLRLENQRTLCLLRDAIAQLSGLDAEQVQNAFEEEAFLKQRMDAASDFMKALS